MLFDRFRCSVLIRALKWSIYPLTVIRLHITYLATECKQKNVRIIWIFLTMAVTIKMNKQEDINGNNDKTKCERKKDVELDMWTITAHA